MAQFLFLPQLFAIMETNYNIGGVATVNANVKGFASDKPNLTIVREANTLYWFMRDLEWL